MLIMVSYQKKIPGQDFHNHQDKLIYCFITVFIYKIRPYYRAISRRSFESM